MGVFSSASYSGGAQFDENRWIVAEGDSLSTDLGNGQTPWPNQLMLLSNWVGRGRLARYATSGNLTSSVLGRASCVPSLSGTASGIFFLLAGSNDLNGGATGAAVLASVNSIAGLARARGYKIVLFEIPPATMLTGPEEVNRVAFNAGLGALANDGIVPAATLLPNPLDATLFIDGIHFTTAGGAVVANWINSNLSESLLGT